MDIPTLSVLIPNYNHALFIVEALDAILSQSYRPFEVLVMDDGSTDNSRDVISCIAEKNRIVKLLCNDRNMGVLYTAKKLLEAASGDYIYWASADDKVLPGFFEKSLNLLMTNKQAALCCSNPVYFDAKTGVSRVVELNWSKDPRYLSPQELSLAIKDHKGYIYGHTSILKRSIVLEVGGLDPKLKWHSDWYLMHLIGFRYGICYIPEPLASMRSSVTSYSANDSRDWSVQKGILGLMIELLKSKENKDVLPFFQNSQISCVFGTEMIRTILSNPKRWDKESLKLLAISSLVIKDLLYNISPDIIKKIYRKYIKTAKQQ